MPQLPSGKHIGLYPNPLHEILEEACNGFKAHALMMIQKPQDLFSYIEVLYFKLRKDSKLREDKYFTFSMVPPEELMPYPSGYNLITIQNEIKNWEYCDQKAFIDFLNSKRTENFLNKLTHTVEEVRNQLLDNPSSLQGMLATWWKLGCHPLQGEDS